MVVLLQDKNTQPCLLSQQAMEIRRKASVPRGFLILWGPSFRTVVSSLQHSTLRVRHSGWGVISLPAAFEMSGVVMSIILLVAVTLCTVYSVGLMMEAVELTGYNSYADLSRNLFGRGWDYFTVFLTWLFTFGTCVGYVIAIGHLFGACVVRPVRARVT
ncbi:Amino acid transporter [Trypanosoma melophagium]|uniref:Amino acid transporter n=1 Tax=Trypanosoma melophagium TaxID=715481 RepID=UPI00351A96EC|nr:Amino acid transporter [Trypanosoma melophagium]